MRLIFTIITLSAFGYILQIFTGIVLFFQKYGFYPETVTKYIQDKSFIGVLEIVLPHLVVIPVVSFVLLHFMYYLPVSRKIILFSALVFVSGFLESFSTILVYFFGKSYSFIKILTFFIFEIGILAFSLFVIFGFRKFHRF